MIKATVIAGLLSLIATPVFALDFDIGPSPRAAATFDTLDDDMLFETSFELPRRTLGEVASGLSLPDQREWGNFTLAGGGGFTFGPSGLLATAEADFWVIRQFSFGPIVQFSLWDKIILGWTAAAKGTVDFPEWSWTERIKPYGFIGIGGALVSAPKPRDNENRTEFSPMVSMGTGVDFYPFAQDNISVSAGVIFNFLPDDPRGEDFFMSLQAAIRFHF